VPPPRCALVAAPTKVTSCRQCDKESRKDTAAVKSWGLVMNYLRLILLLAMFAFATPAFAQICCPSGCVNDYNPPRCVYTGTTRTCPSVACFGNTGNTSGGGGNFPAVTISPPPCTVGYPTQEARDIATNTCVAHLAATATFWGCTFEDDAGRAEDRRTGLSCAARQAALAQQCRARCAAFARSVVTCKGLNEVWPQSFGDIGGERYGYARIDLCGPRLRTSVGNLIRPPASGGVQTQRSP